MDNQNPHKRAKNEKAHVPGHMGQHPRQNTKRLPQGGRRKNLANVQERPKKRAKSSNQLIGESKMHALLERLPNLAVRFPHLTGRPPDLRA